MTKSSNNGRSAKRPVRTLGQVLAQLPGKDLPLLRIDPLPNDELPILTIPGVDELSPGPGLPDGTGTGDEILLPTAVQKSNRSTD